MVLILIGETLLIMSEGRFPDQRMQTGEQISNIGESSDSLLITQLSYQLSIDFPN